MNLKEHNDIVQKLLAQIDSKQKQINDLNKQLNKNSKNQQLNDSKISKGLQSVQTQKIIQKRIAQLNKEHTAKITQLNQQIKTLTQQNKDLTERVNLKNNIDAKQKDHIVQVMKKNFDRKPGTGYDHKVAALTSHYQEEINKKNNYIDTLKRQIKSLSLNETTNKKLESPKNKNHSQKQVEIQFNENDLKETILMSNHKEQIQKLQIQIQKYRKGLEGKNSQLKQLKVKYNDLTKEYYRVVNEFGVNTDFNKQKFTKKNKPEIISKVNKNPSQNQSIKKYQNNFIKQMPKNPLSNLLQDLCIDEMNSSVSVDFQQKFKKFTNRPKINEQQNLEQMSLNYSNLKQEDFTDEDQDQPKSTMRKPFSRIQSDSNEIYGNEGLLDQIRSLLNLQKVSDILPYLNNCVVRLNDIELYDTILRSLHSFFYKFGMGKVSKTDMLQTLERFQDKVNKWIQNSQMLDEICIQVGAKRDKLILKICEMKNVQSEYLQKMRNVQFLIQLKKSQKLIEFINFFELDKSQLELPQQLKNIYQQLRFVDKFIKQANMTLGIQLKDTKGLENTLEIILRKLQYYAEWEYELMKQKELKAAKKAKKRQNMEGIQN